MKKKYFTIWIWFIVLVLFSLTVPSYGQNKPITYSDVVEMSKAGLSDLIIITKIKESETSFILNTSDLINLKQEGVSDLVVQAMIERDKEGIEKKLNTSDTSLPVLNPALAVGKRKVFIETHDQESKVELTKRLTNRKFVIVDSQEKAELLFEFRVDEGMAQTRTGIFRGVETTTKTRTGTLIVTLIDGKPIGIIFAREWEPRFSTGIYGTSGPPRIRDQIRYFFVPEYAKLLNKAGDKIP